MVLTIRLGMLVLVAAAFTTAFNKDASAVTAEELLRSCEIAIQQSTPVGPGRTWVPTEGELCWHYFEAVYDLAKLVDRKSCNPLPCNNPTLRICPPEDATFTQYIRVFVTAAQKKNPGLLNLLAAGMAVAALQDAFPCQ
jgi:Rap1a immunity proteins